MKRREFLGTVAAGMAVAAVQAFGSAASTPSIADLFIKATRSVWPSVPATIANKHWETVPFFITVRVHRELCRLARLPEHEELPDGMRIAVEVKYRASRDYCSVWVLLKGRDGRVIECNLKHWGRIDIAEATANRPPNQNPKM